MLFKNIKVWIIKSQGKGMVMLIIRGVSDVGFPIFADMDADADFTL